MGDLNPQTFAERIAVLEDTADHTDKRIHNLEVLGTLFLSVLVGDMPQEAFGDINNSFQRAFQSLEGDNDVFHPSFVTADDRRVTPDGSKLFDLPDDYTRSDMFQDIEPEIGVGEMLANLVDELRQAGANVEVIATDDYECDCDHCREQDALTD